MKSWFSNSITMGFAGGGKRGGGPPSRAVDLVDKLKPGVRPGFSRPGARRRLLFLDSRRPVIPFAALGPVSPGGHAGTFPEGFVKGAQILVAYRLSYFRHRPLPAGQQLAGCFDTPGTDESGEGHAGAVLKYFAEVGGAQVGPSRQLLQG